uniref:Ribosomal protein S11 n=1 Tax=Mitrastemon kanehirai TaxID=1358725 RepID=A0A4Y1MCC1_9ERIC|nr:ribosomal protein S11 [Mitrastemon kanehirai]
MKKKLKLSKKNIYTQKIKKGIIYIQSSINNIILTITNEKRQILFFTSAGICGFKGKRRGTPFAAQTSAYTIIKKIKNKSMQQVEILIKGPGIGRDAALQIIRKNIKVISIKDVTHMPYNGCRPPKIRRI